MSNYELMRKLFYEAGMRSGSERNLFSLCGKLKDMKTSQYATEQQYQAACFEWFHNTYHEHRKMLHCNNNNSSDSRSGNRNKALGVVPGVSDLELIIEDCVVFIELKINGNGLSEDQKEFRTAVRKKGHLYFVIEDTLEAFQNLIKQYI